MCPSRGGTRDSLCAKERQPVGQGPLLTLKGQAFRGSGWSEQGLRGLTGGDHGSPSANASRVLNCPSRAQTQATDQQTTA